LAEEDGPAAAVLGAISAASFLRLQRKVKQPETGLSQNHQNATTLASAVFFDERFRGAMMHG
jgi:hypothetical protein